MNHLWAQLIWEELSPEFQRLSHGAHGLLPIQQSPQFSSSPGGCVCSTMGIPGPQHEKVTRINKIHAFPMLIYVQLERFGDMCNSEHFHQGH